MLCIHPRSHLCFLPCLTNHRFCTDSHQEHPHFQALCQQNQFQVRPSNCSVFYFSHRPSTWQDSLQNVAISSWLDIFHIALSSHSLFASGITCSIKFLFLTQAFLLLTSKPSLLASGITSCLEASLFSLSIAAPCKRHLTFRNLAPTIDLDKIDSKNVATWLVARSFANCALYKFALRIKHHF